MHAGAFRLIYRCHVLSTIILLFFLLLGMGTTDLTTAYAVTYDLTGDGLGLSQGNYGKTLTVSPVLSLSSLCCGSRTGYPNGYNGTIYLHQDEGVGVQTCSFWQPGYPRIDGYGTGSYESLIFDFSTPVDAQSITLFTNRIDNHYGYVWIDIWVKPTSGSAFNVSDVLSYFHYTGGDSGYFNFSEFPDLNGVGSIKRIIVRAGKYAHFYVDGIDYDLYMDNDDDGYPADQDCDDNNPDINPGATELCNGVDDNCDGDVDEGCVIYYRDADSDGYGNSSDTTTIPQSGYVTNGTDCNDTNANIYPGATERCNGIDDDCDGGTDEGCTLYYLDSDGDGYGDLSQSVTDTSPPPGYVENSGDCDDGNYNVNPGAIEICNAMDDNCDGNTDEGCTTYYRDADGDGYGDSADTTTDTSPPPGYVENSEDCNDSNPNINPGITEICNGVDDNCVAGVDEGCTEYYLDSDGDGYGDPAQSVTDTSPPPDYVANSDDCDDTSDSIHPGATEVPHNGEDDDCDAATPDDDLDGDLYPVATDCNDNDNSINPGATEVCNDGIDNDCDTLTDCVDSNCSGDPPHPSCCTDNDGDGYYVQWWCPRDVDCNDGDNSVNPGATEVCDDGIDNDCDGLTDSNDSDCPCTDSDNDGYYVEPWCPGPVDCNDGDNSVNPGATEVCDDGIDNDCDGHTDGADSECIPSCIDNDGDGYGDPGDPSCSGGSETDCDDADPSVNPGASEMCDGVNNDCDAGTADGSDEPWLNDPCDGPDTDQCMEGTLSCSGGLQVCSDDSGDDIEICDDGFDNDCDALTDCDDPNCTGLPPCCSPVAQSIDASGGSKDFYFANEGVYVRGTCLPPNINVDIYIVGDLAWSKPMAIPPDVSTDGANTVPTDSAGKLGPAIVWPPPLTPGEYDIVLDVNQNGTYDGFDAVDNPNHPGFTVCTDHDGDGYHVEGGACGAVDCDDTNDEIYPGAPELCNGVDDDCDGAVDEGCVTYYEDADGDGYGNPAVPITSPAPPPGYVANSADCDDNNAHIHPGAAERCNNLRDDDCDGIVNEGCISGTGFCLGVGGIAWPINKIGLVAPWVALIMSMIGLVVCLVRWRKRPSPGGR